MNIEKLAKYLKEFTLDEISMIAEVDCKTELEHLLNGDKIVFENGKYKYVETDKQEDFIIYTNKKLLKKKISAQAAFQNFMVDYVKKNCKVETYVRYRSVIKYHLTPFFTGKNINDINNNDIKEIYVKYKSQNLPPKTIRNNLSLLNQVIKYYQHLGIIDRKCNFQVRRLTSKNEFSMNRIIFEGD